MNVPIYCYLDIETIPAGKMEKVLYPKYPKLEDVKIGQRKGKVAESYRNERYPILIDEYNKTCKVLLEKENEKYRKRALISTQSEILCLAYAFDDEKIEVLTGSEERIIKQFGEVLEQFGDKKYSITYVGHNIRDFDLKRLYHRAFLYDCESLKDVFKFMPKDKVKDTMEIWGFHSYRDYTSLDEILTYFGLEGKKDIDGSMVFDYYIEGKLTEIYDYCKGDVDKVRKLFKILL